MHVYVAEKNLTWNRLSDENMTATLKLCSVRVYVTKDRVAARTGSEVASAKLKWIESITRRCAIYLDLLR